VGATIAAGAISIIPPNNPVSITLATADTASLAYTVPTGKTFYCTGLTIENQEAGAITYSIKVVATSVVSAQVQQYDVVSFSGQPVFAATSGQAIYFYAAVTRSAILNMWGFYI